MVGAGALVVTHHAPVGVGMLAVDGLIVVAAIAAERFGYKPPVDRESRAGSAPPSGLCISCPAICWKSGSIHRPASGITERPHLKAKLPIYCTMFLSDASSLIVTNV